MTLFSILAGAFIFTWERWNTSSVRTLPKGWQGLAYGAHEGCVFVDR